MIVIDTSDESMYGSNNFYFVCVVCTERGFCLDPHTHGPHADGHAAESGFVKWGEGGTCWVAPTFLSRGVTEVSESGI